MSVVESLVESSFALALPMLLTEVSISTSRCTSIPFARAYRSRSQAPHRDSGDPSSKKGYLSRIQRPRQVLPILFNNMTCQLDGMTTWPS
jgi:hypothetical protein